MLTIDAHNAKFEEHGVGEMGQGGEVLAACDRSQMVDGSGVAG